MVNTRSKSKLTRTGSLTESSSNPDQGTFNNLLKHVRDLRDQSRRVVQNLVEHDDPFEMYDGLSAANQRKLFSELWRDHERLRRLEETHKVIAKGVDSMPSADKALAQNYEIRTSDIRYDGNYEGFGKYDEGTVYYYSDDSYDTPEEDKSPGHIPKKRKIAEKRPVVDKETGKIDIFADGYMVKGYFRRQWLYGSSKAKNVPPRERSGKNIQWVGHSLCAVPGDSELLLPKLGDLPDWQRSICEPSPTCDNISSQLLLYRLAAIFGMPPSSNEIDDETGVWSATLLEK